MSALDEKKRFNITQEFETKSIACRTEWSAPFYADGEISYSTHLCTGQYLGKILIKDIWYAIVLWEDAIKPDMVTANILEVSRDCISWEPLQEELHYVDSRMRCGR